MLILEEKRVNKNLEKTIHDILRTMRGHERISRENEID